ncbi:MAG: S8 family serine peptidase [Spirochaetes bacterium]|nr:S8 family serine peptidase [Spirochaetota bacterium]
MRVNNYSVISLFAAGLLFAVAGCSNTRQTSVSSVSGVLSVPVTGEQHYEEYETGGDFGDDFENAKEIGYEDTAHGTIASSDDDYFWFNGVSGDSVVIDIDAEALGSGLDSYLYLYDQSRSKIAENDDYPIGWQDDPANFIFVYDSHIETTLDASGTYYIRVEGYGTTTGAYRLRLFQYDSGAAGAGPSPQNAEFVEDEIIVKFIPGFDPESVKADPSTGYRPVKTALDTGSGALSLFKLSEEEKSSKVLSTTRERTLAETARLGRLSYVEYAEPNYIMRPTFVPNDTHYHLQWHYPIIRLDQVWDEYAGLSIDLSDVRVAVIDTGIGRTTLGYDHPDLAGIFADEYDFISDPANALDGDGIDSDATDPGDDPAGQFSSFHGTHVTGTVGALTNNDEIGVAGIAGGSGTGNGVTIIPLRALGAQGGNVYDIAQAVRYAAGLVNDSGGAPSSIADIINMSLGAPVDSQTLRNAIDAAYNAGVLIVASAGNEGTSVPFYPASYTNVVSVSAVGPGNELAPYSSFGPTVDIAAPGGDTGTNLTFDLYPDGVLSTLFNQNGAAYSPIYAFYQGTSMAAPHVSGVCALILAADGDLGPSDVRNILSSTAIDLGQPGTDIYYGHGLVNAYAAVKSALGETQNPVLYPFPRAIKLEGTNPSGSFLLKNIGGEGTITVDGIAEANDPEGLVSSIDPDGTPSFNVDAGGVEVNVTLSTAGLDDGKTHYARLEIGYGASRTEYVYVLYNKNGITSFYENEDVGYVFVVAVDPASYQTVAQDVTSYNEGYSYTVGGLSAGDYLIIAGTDRDSDLEICDPGEACGFYPLFGSSTPITVGEGTVVSGIDFQVIDNASQGPGSTVLRIP